MRKGNGSVRTPGESEGSSIVGAVLREQRRKLNLTLEEVATRANITKGFLSEIERDVSVPSVPTLTRLLNILSLSFKSIFTSTSPRIVRANKRQLVVLAGLNTKYFLLSGSNSHRVSVVWAELDPGADSGEKPLVLTSDEEFILVVSGTFKITVDGGITTLNAGDAFTFDPRRPHRYWNPSRDQTTVTLCVMAPPHQ